MKVFDLNETGAFEGPIKKTWVHDSPYFRLIAFHLRAGETFPVHAHDVDGQLSILVLEGEGEFLGEGEKAIPARAGQILVCDIREPHGVRARTDMRFLVTIAPPF